MILSGKCKEDFLNSQGIMFNMLSNEIKNLIIYRWFNTQTKISIDIINWQEDGFDYGVTHPVDDIVFLSPFESGKRIKDFDFILSLAIRKGNDIYNECYSVK
jgi:hypothetical protein